MDRIIKTSVILLVAGMMSVQPAKAQLDDLGIFNLSLAELMQIKVRGATLTSESLKKVPTAVTVFSQAQIKLLGLDTLDELMNLVPGFQAYRSNGTPLDYPYSSRGRRVSVPSAEILIMLDGHRIDDARSNGAAVVVPSFSLKQIETVEFIRGPGAAIYGSNAMMGVINIVSRSGVNRVGASVGSFNRKNAYAFASKRLLGGHLDFYGNVEADSGEDYTVPDIFNSGYTNTDDPRQRAEFNLKYQWYDTLIQAQYSENQADNFVSITSPANGINYRKSSLASLSLKQAFSWHSLESYVWLGHSYSTTDVRMQRSPPSAFELISEPSSAEPLIQRGFFEGFSESRAQWHVDWTLAADANLQFGFEFRHLDVPELTGKANFDLGALGRNELPIRYSDDVSIVSVAQLATSRNIWGAYSQYQRDLWEKSHLTFGLRYDRFDEIGEQVSPRIGLVQEFGDSYSLKLLYGEAFRAPAENELNLVNAPAVGNLSVTPETVNTWELIGYGQWQHTELTWGYFENRFQDSIELVAGSGGQLEYRNIDGDEFSKGIEFEISHELNREWLLKGTYTRLLNKPENSLREAGVLASGVINYQRQSWNANVSAVYRGNRAFYGMGGDQVSLDTYWVLNGKVQYGLSEQWNIFLQVKNIAGNDYFTPPVGAPFSEGLPNRGRELLLGGEWQF